MQKATLLALAAMLIVVNTSWSSSFENHVLCVYPPAKELVEKEFPGPIAAELAQASVLRQGLEDGLDRSHNLCINGMGVGGRNKEVFDSIKLPPDISLSKVTAEDGMLSYQLKGPRANLIGVLAIAKWLDKHIVELPGISSQNKLMWDYCKRMSYLLTTPFGDVRHQEKLDEYREQRAELIDRVNGMYGPGGSSLRQKRRELQSIFQRAVE